MEDIWFTVVWNSQVCPMRLQLYWYYEYSLPIVALLYTRPHLFSSICGMVVPIYWSPAFLRPVSPARLLIAVFLLSICKQADIHDEMLFPPSLPFSHHPCALPYSNYYVSFHFVPFRIISSPTHCALILRVPTTTPTRSGNQRRNTATDGEAPWFVRFIHWFQFGLRNGKRFFLWRGELHTLSCQTPHCSCKWAPLSFIFSRPRYTSTGAIDCNMSCDWGPLYHISWSVTVRRQVLLRFWKLLNMKRAISVPICTYMTT